ncbi:hypothetical protein BaRGS_00033225 [Batillaria attramentaria]|uniref:Uncharacterized protein n=1 Tax=Batillaria attramentaria TaxID=370345 RepID=A0ABD0JKY6_9CAEN
MRVVGKKKKLLRQYLHAHVLAKDEPGFSFAPEGEAKGTNFCLIRRHGSAPQHLMKKANKLQTNRVRHGIDLEILPRDTPENMATPEIKPCL